MTKHQNIPINDFPAGNIADWETLAARLLKGRPVKDALSFTTLDGIVVEGFSTGGETVPLPLRPGATGAWDIRTEYRLNDPKAANDAILNDLERGITSLHLHLENASLDDLDRALDGVLLDLAPISINGDPKLLMDLWERREVSPDKALGAFNLEPLTGDINAAKNYPSVTSTLADALPAHERGASDAQELAIAMTAGLGYLRRMDNAGLSLKDAAEDLLFRFAVDVNFFQQIAKLRAARVLWAGILDVCGVDTGNATMAIWAVTSPRIMTKRDPYVNMLRGTGACFAAQAGGANTITVLPFTHALGQPDAFARRMARNIQVILQEESGLGHIGDPAAGSFAIESLTSRLAEAAWNIFQQLEAGSEIDPVIASTRESRDLDIATRKQPIIGVSEYPNLAERPVDIAGSPSPGGLAEPYEFLRDASDAWLVKTGKRPGIFLANLGKPTEHMPRAMFAKNFFEAGGIEARLFDGTLDPDEMVAALMASGAELAVICGSDTQYEASLTAMATALKAAGVRRLYKAGKPDNDPEEIDGHIHIGINVIEELRTALKTLGIIS